MEINKINHTGFKASLDISKCKNYKPYWDAVAKNFEQRTMNKRGCLELLPSSFGQAPTFRIKNADTLISCETEVFDNLTNSYPIEVAIKLAKLFDMGKEITKEKNSLEKSFNKKFGRVTVNNFESYVKNVIAREDEIIKKIENIIAKDESLNGFSITI